MKRRTFVKGLAAAGLCPLCARGGLAEETGPRSHEGDSGPDHWGTPEDSACLLGDQQSPLDLTGAIKAELPALEVRWRAGGGTLVNNGHTLQVELPDGGRLLRGARAYELLQFHFHAPSEHLVAGTRFAMEVHFVHRRADSQGLGVLGVFMIPGAANPAFAGLARAFPGAPGGAVEVSVDPAALLPARLDYWTYEGSLTTPPCSEIVDWTVVQQPLAVDPADIARFTALYSMNARPVVPSNRRYILSSS